jgi:hypothetical protein
MEVDNLYAHERALVKVHSILLYPQGHMRDDPTIVSHVMMNIEIVP